MKKAYSSKDRSAVWVAIVGTLGCVLVALIQYGFTYKAAATAPKENIPLSEVSASLKIKGDSHPVIPEVDKSQARIAKQANFTYAVVINEKDRQNKLVGELIEKELVEYKLTLVERGQMKLLIEEMKISNTNIFSENSAVKIGKLVGAAKILTFSADSYDGRKSITQYGLKEEIATPSVTVSVKLLDVSTGVINASCSKTINGAPIFISGPMESVVKAQQQLFAEAVKQVIKEIDFGN